MAVTAVYAICLLFLATGTNRAAVVYVDATATGANDGRSWAHAFTTIQAAIDTAYAIGGSEVWVKAGTYTGCSSEPVSDSFEVLNPDSVDVIGEEREFVYQAADGPRYAHLTILYLTGDVTVAPPSVTFGDTTEQHGFATRVTALVQSHGDVLVFANHPSFTKDWKDARISQEDLAAAANAGAIHAVEIKVAEDAAKWDYVLANLDDQAGDCSKTLWAICSDDQHRAANVDWSKSGVMMGSISTTRENPVYADRRIALRDMIRRGSTACLTPGSRYSMPGYRLEKVRGQAGSFEVSLFVYELDGEAAKIQFRGCDWETGSAPGTLLYESPVTQQAANSVSYYLTQSGTAQGIPLTEQQKANMKYVRPVLTWRRDDKQYYAYLQPVRIRSDGRWWDGPAYTLAGSHATIGPSPYPAGGADTGETVYFNTHAHTLLSDGDATPHTMRMKYWTEFGEIDPGKPRFGLVTDHNRGTVFSPPTRSVVVLREEVRIYGGFAGTETSREQHDPRSNVTTIDAQGAGRCVYSCGSDWRAKTDAVLDGFLLRNGKVGGLAAGGGMHNYDCSPTIRDCRFEDNEASIGGGMCNSSASPSVKNCTFSYNTAQITPPWHPGGGMFNESGSAPVIEDCSFYGNTARRGGGMCNMSSSPTVTDCLFFNNSVSGFYNGWGGGMYNLYSSPAVTGCVFYGNSADATYGSGGGMCNDESDATVIGCTFTRNHADGSAGFGGGIYSRSSRATIANCLFSANSAAGPFGSGGAVYDCDQRGASAAMTNNTIVENTAVYGGGVYRSSATPATVANNIIAFNSSGIHDYSNGPAKLLDNCVYGNTDYNYAGIPPGVRDMARDPQFADLSNGDYHLRITSPCVNSGCNSAADDGGLDMDGEPRILPVGSTVDIGADEYNGAPLFTAGEAKRLLSDGEQTLLTGRGPMVVTAKFEDIGCFYVEQADRSAGIQCRGDVLLEPGQAAVLQGTMNTVDGERVLTGTFVLEGSLASAAIPEPAGMINRVIGGRPAGLQQGIAGASGLNNIGLLITTTGRVTYADTDYFYLDDGSKLDDGSGHLGVKVLATGLSIPASDSYVQVTGISSCFKVGDDLYRLIRVREQVDIVVVE